MALLFIIQPILESLGWRLAASYTLINFVVVIFINLSGLFIIITGLPGLGIAERVLVASSIIWSEIIAIKLTGLAHKDWLSNYGQIK